MRIAQTEQKLIDRHCPSYQHFQTNHVCSASCVDHIMAIHSGSDSDCPSYHTWLFCHISESPGPSACHTTLALGWDFTLFLIPDALKTGDCGW